MIFKTLRLIPALGLSAAFLLAHQQVFAESNDVISTDLAFVYTLPEGERVTGSRATLDRGDNHICAAIATNDVMEGAYTGWWLIFNQPQFCEHGAGIKGASCGEADLANPSVDGTVMWASAGIAGYNGQLQVAGCIAEGELTHAVLPMGNQMGLTDAQTAEVHVVIRNHGTIDYYQPALLGEQLSSFGGGCNTEMADGYACENEQIAVFPARASKK